MDTSIEPTLGEIQRLRDSAWKAIGTSTVDGAERTKYWTAWTAHCAMYGSHSDTRTKTPDTDKLFAVAVREGKYGRGTQVKVQSVEKALRHVAQKLVLDGHPDPQKASPAQQSLDLPISCLLKSFGNRDPPAEPKLAIPISTITTISTYYQWTPHLDAVGDLVTMAFFYLLRVGEYTSPTKPRDKRTIPLRLCDMRRIVHRVCKRDGAGQAGRYTLWLVGGGTVSVVAVAVVRVTSIPVNVVPGPIEMVHLWVIA
jgi:hypothetical protein